MHVYIGRDAESIYTDVNPLIIGEEFISIKDKIQNDMEYNYKEVGRVYGDVYGYVVKGNGRK